MKSFKDLRQKTKLDEISTDKLRDYASAALQDKDKSKAAKRWKYAGKAMQKVADREVKAKHDLKYNKTEAVEEKTLTPAEKKKREEIAKAMERDNPGMDMKKKMAIATWQAKKVAEAKVDEISLSHLSNTIAKSTGTKNIKTAMKPGEVKKGLDDLKKRLATLGQEPKLAKEAKEEVQSADKKPEKYIKPDGKVGIRMVRVDKKVVDKDA